MNGKKIKINARVSRIFASKIDEMNVFLAKNRVDVDFLGRLLIREFLNRIVLGNQESFCATRRLAYAVCSNHRPKILGP